MNGEDCAVTRQHYGKYRGKVVSTEDPTMSGKLLCFVPSLPGMLLNWAVPSVSYAGIEEGMFALPEEGADVWIEFEGADPNHPIWTGGYWEDALEPVVPEISPEAPELVKVLRSKTCTVILNDTPGVGGITMVAGPPAVELPVTFTMSSLGIVLEVGELSLTMNPEVGITLTAGESVCALTPEGAATEAPTIDLTAESDINVTSPLTSVDGDVNVAGPLEVEGATTLVGEASVGGDFSVEGAAEVTGETNLAGAVTVEGEANFLGVVTVEGESNMLGEVSIEGDLNVLGAQQTEGNNATAGLIEGVLVPPGI